RWKDDQIHGLLDTILNSKYDFQFLGAIITLPHKSQDELHIIDGQQRITTIYLTLLVLYKESLKHKDDVFTNSIANKIHVDRKFILKRADDNGAFEKFHKMYLDDEYSDQYAYLFHVMRTIKSILLQSNLRDENSKLSIKKN